MHAHMKGQLGVKKATLFDILIKESLSRMRQRIRNFRFFLNNRSVYARAEALFKQ